MRLRHPKQSVIVLCALAIAALLAVPAPAAPSENRLDEAYRLFRLGKFPDVLAILKPSDKQPPRRLSADFMTAVSLCRTGSKTAGLSRLAQLQTDFLVTQEKSRAIGRQITDCGVGKLPIAGIEGKADDGDAAQIAAARGASADSPQMGGLEIGVTYNQGDIRSLSAASAIECSSICLADKQCRAMTYITSQRLCWIKGSVPSRRARSSDMTSAVKLFE